MHILVIITPPAMRVIRTSDNILAPPHPCGTDSIVNMQYHKVMHDANHNRQVTDKS